MSREEDDKAFIRNYINEREADLEVDVRVSDVRDGLRAGIAYGRSTPDREMLNRLVYSVVMDVATGKHVLLPGYVDEFLTLENQRGEDGSR
jgi:hypothetical protein